MTAPGTPITIATGWWPKRSIRLFPARALLTLTGGTPIVQPAGKLLRPAAASLVLTGGTPTVQPAGKYLTPAAASLLLTGGTPVLGTAVRPAGATLTLTGGTPQLQTGLRPAGATLTLTGGTPTVTVAPTTPFDDFNRANSTTTLGSNWTNRNNVMGISSNEAYPVTANSHSNASHNTTLTGDDFDITVTLGTLVGSNDSFYIFGGMNTSGQGSAMGAGAGGFGIYTIASWALGSANLRVSGSLTATVGDTLTFRRVGNVYTLLKNGGAVSGATWTDSGGALTRDSSHRLVGIGSDSVSSSYRRFNDFAAH